MKTMQNPLLQQTRRHFFQTCGFGIGSLALSSLTSERLFAEAVAARAPDFAPKAKSIIFLFMAGGPSQLDLFDRNPPSGNSTASHVQRI